jgi:type I restriction enzyme S subunit
MTWAVRSLAEVADFELGKMLDQVKNKGEPRPYLANVNVRWGEFDLAELREMRFEAHELERFSVRHGDIVMCEGGEPGRCARWTIPLEGVMFQKALHRIRPRVGLDSTFLYYEFLCIGRTGGFDPYFTGATIKHLPREQLAKVQIRVPELRVQHAIAAVLEPYDDLIAVNQRRIALLEDAARRLYREWFVYLRFPGHEVKRMTDGLPQGWHRENLFDVCEVTYGFPFKSELFNADGAGLPAIRIRDVPSVQVSTYTTEEVHGDYEVVRGDLLVGMDGIFHMNHWAGPKGLLVQRVCRVRPRSELLRAYVGLALNGPIKELERSIQGATVAHLGAKHLKQIELFVPAGVDAELGTLNDLLWQVVCLREQIEQLTRARNLLLPKLMSGKLGVSSIRLPEEATA